MPSPREIRGVFFFFTAEKKNLQNGEAKICGGEKKHVRDGFSSPLVYIQWGSRTSKSMIQHYDWGSSSEFSGFFLRVQPGLHPNKTVNSRCFFSTTCHLKVGTVILGPLDSTLW